MSPELTSAISAMEGLLAAAPPAELPGLMGEMERLRVALLVRLLPAAPASAPPATTEGRLLNVEDAAAIAGVPPRWFNRHKDLPFARKVGKYLRIDEAGLRRWLSARKA